MAMAAETAFAPERLRNVALVAHGGAGKTSLAEGLLFLAGVVDRLGRVDDGTSALDTDPDEVRRRITIHAHVAPIPWRDGKLNLLDTPGYFDFVGEVKAALRVADAAVVVVDAVAGVEVGTELVWRYADELNLPRLVFVNKMDRENASFERALEGLRSLGRVLPLQLPIGREASFRGAVDVLRGRALLWGARGAVQEGEVPPEMAGDAEAARQALAEAAAEADDELLEKYLEAGELTPDEAERGVRAAIASGRFAGVLCGAATSLAGLAPLADAAWAYLPSAADGELRGRHPRTGEPQVRRRAADEPLAALVWKTMADPYVGRLTLFRVYAGVMRSDSQVHNAGRDAPERVGQLYAVRGKEQRPVGAVGAGDIGAVAKLQVTATGDTLCDPARPLVLAPAVFPEPVYTVAVEPKAKGDEDKISAGLQRLAEEDPTFRIERNTETHQTLVSGMGELHLDVVVDRLRRKFGVEVVTAPPRIPYRETIRGRAKAEGKHKKQTGGRGQYGHVFLELEPLERGRGFEFVDKIFGGAVPKQYIPAVEKGVRETMEEGVLAGYPVTDVRVTLYDGSFHPVDSSELAFKIAASLAFKKAFGEANPVLLEPILEMEVTVPEEFLGDVMGDLNKKRARILGIDARGALQVVRAQVPAAEAVRYAIDLRSMTQGRGLFRTAFSHYEEVPAPVAQSVLEAARAAAHA
jgi:elongation factor G